MSKNTSIVAAGKLFDAGCRVVLWDEEQGLSFYPGGAWSKGRYSARELELDELRKKITGFYIHHSVTYFAESTFRVLKARNLSCVFIIDDDINEDGCSTIYQCLDCKDGGWSQGGEHNRLGAGVEISYYPDAWDHPNRYSEAKIKKWGVQPHEIKTDVIHGHTFKKVFAPTDAQIKACTHLIYAYLKAFPDLKQSFPRAEDGSFISTIVPEEERIGLLQHFSIRRDKIDAMGFPTDQVEKDVESLQAEYNIEQLKRSKFMKLFRKWFGKRHKKLQD